MQDTPEVLPIMLFLPNFGRKYLLCRTPAKPSNVISACLTFAVTVGAHMDGLCIVGGLVPSLLIDHQLGTARDAVHPGTNDLDVGLAVAVLDDNGYQAISTRLRAEGFEAIKNAKGNTDAAADAHGYVDDLLRRCRAAGLRITRDG